MIAWYQTKESCSLEHAGQTIEPGQKILLTEELAALHNSVAVQVETASTPPKDFTEAAVKSDFDEYELTLTVTPSTSNKKSSASSSTLAS